MPRAPLAPCTAVDPFGKAAAWIACLVASSWTGTTLEAPPHRSQALSFFVERFDLVVEQRALGLRRIVAAQLVEHFANGEFRRFGHGQVTPLGRLCERRSTLASGPWSNERRMLRAGP